jgi:eukaryotic-like serine/threonine-protein kinase
MAQRARDYQPGEQVPGTVYQVVRLIGAGGMGTVYDVKDTTIEKRYVLKTLHPQHGQRLDLARRIQNEARTLARLNHPNIVEVITAGVTGDDLRLPFFVMERLNGQSLRLVLEKKGQLEIPHAYHIAIDLLDALDHAHDKGVIHRDVKPDNIFLHRTSAGVTVTKLLDFGILSVLGATFRDTAGRFVGTLRYAAPEQLRGDIPTPKVDVYAAGLVLYEMIAGRGPFDDLGDPQAVGAAHLERSPPRLSRFVEVPPELEDLVMAALAKAPEARPADAFSFAASLRDLKRLSIEWRARESTEDRATAAAVVGSEVARYVEIRQPSPDGPYVIAPAGKSRPVEPTSFPRTTLHGMVPPTISPSRAGGTGPTAAAAAVDRVGPTATFVPPAAMRARHGTEPYELAAFDAPSEGRTPETPLAVESPLRWPAERAIAKSDEPHMHTLSTQLRPSRFSRSVIRSIGVVGACGLIVAMGAFAVHRFPEAMGRATAVTTATPAVSLQAQPPSPVPSPPLQPLPVAPSGTAERAIRVNDGADAQSAPPLPRPKRRPSPAVATSAASASRLDRPGPGF